MLRSVIFFSAVSKRQDLSNSHWWRGVQSGGGKCDEMLVGRADRVATFPHINPVIFFHMTCQNTTYNTIVENTVTYMLKRHEGKTTHVDVTPRDGDNCLFVCFTAAYLSAPLICIDNWTKCCSLTSQRS